MSLYFLPIYLLTYLPTHLCIVYLKWDKSFMKLYFDLCTMYSDIFCFILFYLFIWKKSASQNLLISIPFTHLYRFQNLLKWIPGGGVTQFEVVRS